MGIFGRQELTSGEVLLDKFYALARKAVDDFFNWQRVAEQTKDYSHIDIYLKAFYECSDFWMRDNNQLEMSVALHRGSRTKNRRDEAQNRAQMKTTQKILQDTYTDATRIKMNLIQSELQNKKASIFDQEYALVCFLAEQNNLFIFGRDGFVTAFGSFSEEDWKELGRVFANGTLTRDYYKKFRDKKRDYVIQKNKEWVEKYGKPVHEYLFPD